MKQSNADNVLARDANLPWKTMNLACALSGITPCCAKRAHAELIARFAFVDDRVDPRKVVSYSTVEQYRGHASLHYQKSRGSGQARGVI